MFSNLKQLFNRSNKDLRKRIYFTLLCLAVFCFGSNITVPWMSTVYEELGFLEIFNLMSGGGLKSFSIFALGVTPYITAQIITQLLQMDIVPYFKELKEQGYTGKQKINKITRYIGVLFSFIQGYVFTVMYAGTTAPLEILKATVVITAGTSLLLWIGDQITKRGIGNGLSLLIMAGIIQSMPSIFIGAFNALTALSDNKVLGGAIFASFVIVYLLIIIGMVWIQLAERRIPIQYANRTNSAYGKHQNFLPIKINSAGVMPVIFASVIFTIPSFIAGLLDSENAFAVFVTKYVNYTTPVGFAAYIVIIILFCFFYTFLQINPEELSKNLNKQGGYIPGVRPGKETKQYISTVIGRITLIGALFIAVVAGLPIVFSSFINTGLPSSVSLGGTSILIVIGVALETYNKLESSLLNRNYKGGR